MLIRLQISLADSCMIQIHIYTSDQQKAEEVAKTLNKMHIEEKIPIPPSKRRSLDTYEVRTCVYLTYLTNIAKVERAALSPSI